VSGRPQAALLVGLISLAAGCGGTRPAVERPDGTIVRYVRAARAGDAEGAYALLDEDTRAQVPFESFRTLMEENRAELGEQVDELDRLAAEGIEARAHIPLRGGETVVMVLEEGRWVLDGGVLDAPALGTPQETILSLRRALARRSLRGVARVMARQPRAEMEAEIERLLEETGDDLDLQVEVHGDRASVRTTGGREILMIRESGEWRILEVR